MPGSLLKAGLVNGIFSAPLLCDSQADELRMIECLKGFFTQSTIDYSLSLISGPPDHSSPAKSAIPGLFFVVKIMWVKSGISGKP